MRPSLLPDPYTLTLLAAATVTVLTLILLLAWAHRRRKRAQQDVPAATFRGPALANQLYFTLHDLNDALGGIERGHVVDERATLRLQAGVAKLGLLRDGHNVLGTQDRHLWVQAQDTVQHVVDLRMREDISQHVFNGAVDDAHKAVVAALSATRRTRGLDDGPGPSRPRPITLEQPQHA